VRDPKYAAKHALGRQMAWAIFREAGRSWQTVLDFRNDCKAKGRFSQALLDGYDAVMQAGMRRDGCSDLIAAAQ